MEARRVAGWTIAVAAGVLAAGAGHAASRTGPTPATRPEISVPEGARTELASTGSIRIGLVEAPDAGMFFVSRGTDGIPQGVTADLGADLARALGVRAEYRFFPNSGEATEATRTGAVDAAFMPIDDTRRALLAVGPAYYVLESTYLVTAATGITDVAEVDRAGLRVIAIADTTTLRASARTLTNTKPVPVRSVADAIAGLAGGGADAFALSRDTLPAIAAMVPGSRIVTGGFQRAPIAVAVAREHPAGLAFVTAWLGAAKQDGTVAQIFAARGLAGETPAE